MIFEQKEIRLKPYVRGFHLITDIIIAEFPAFRKIEKGILKIFIKHTSASLTINENADGTVRSDFEKHINILVPENAAYYEHIYEGSDDMPAHIKASLLGSFVEIPITKGVLNLGIWQGVYLGEHRNNGGSRSIVVTAFGV
ncbi:secondary thiamine-phosphate synthase enzyme YjbQ [Polaribacter sp. KT 15]|uniref:secondary thiamine-phosphate synthase enzyme YjbQ n=1 Tax=Polaribacter sp. KT 15 TaxID=1896175 RepID=UPI00090C1984|nr:secondary thiamine-phosphate synthase enzyme YjbQ [Polaribacter sp. KT 15]SHM80821.1 secondary thiamine-phosphate synthase enzyme [Polaribacter sp. KT 15]